MKDFDKLTFTLSIICCVLAVIVFFAGVTVGERIIKTKAIAVGAAQWTVNPTNGETTFVFIKPQ